MAALRRLLAAIPLLIFSPVLVLVPLAALACCDLLWRVLGGRRTPADTTPDTSAATIVIPNWNGRDLLATYLPALAEATRENPRNEIIVVDGASADGSAAFVRERFPEVHVVELANNEGFGGNSNAGLRAATNDIVVLLNSDMRVERGFLAPLLAGFTDPQVFAVSCQIFFSDPAKKREETGLTQGWWDRGALRVRHREDDNVTRAFPCFYGGGGSCAFDRRKLLELGGFDSLLAPFYLEDTDLGYLAWKRGWKVLYEPASIVFHEHRGTIGKRFSQAYIERVLKKNFVLFSWKNIHEWRRLLGAFAYNWADGVVSALAGDSPERASLAAMARAFVQLPAAIVSRWRARSLALIDDTEAFRRPLGGYFRDRFAHMPENPKRLSVLFVSPYPICPPVHGGGVFMSQTTRELARLCDLHLIVLLDHEYEREAHDELARRCRSVEFLVRMKGSTHMFGSALPHSVVEFRNRELEWLIHRQIYLHDVDAVQLEYMPMGQYGGAFHRIATVLFEHDVYFQSVGRQLPGMRGITKLKAQIEYLRAIRYELGLLARFDSVQVCSAENRDYVASFRPELRERIDAETRAGIDTARYIFRTDGREPDTMLFLGGFRHLPNVEAMTWFTREVLPHILARRPAARLVLVGAEPPPRHSFPDQSDAIEMRGFVSDVQEPLGHYAVFVCPILSGSGVRVKLLEAFAAGMPVVSTRLGAEGLARVDGEICALADDPRDFAAKVVALLNDQAEARRLACAAREFVVARRDIRTLTSELERRYRALVRAKRAVRPGWAAEVAPQQPCQPVS
ncbi:MAG TPA: glycosyltransferase [Bryobacteraceae bacterium]|nr:glycosyltransferase [Bryobacteraceae bacterium]